MLFDRLLMHFEEARENRLELERKKDFVEDILAENGKKAGKKARETLEKVRKNVGLS